MTDKYKEGEKFWEEVHEAATFFMLALVALHIAGVVVSGRLHKENLVTAMITGQKDQIVWMHTIPPQQNDRRV